MTSTPLSDRMHGTEQERIERIREQYREERERRTGAPPRRWVPATEIYLPLPASVVGGILNLLSEVRDGVVVRQNPSSDRIWYVGWWEDAPRKHQWTDDPDER